MNEEIKKDAEEEMNCILELLEGWCLNKRAPIRGGNL